MKSKTMLLGVMIVAALLIMAQPSVSNAASYSGSWIPNDTEDFFAVEFRSPTDYAATDRFFMFDWGNTANSMEIFAASPFVSVNIMQDTNNIWWAGLDLFWDINDLNLGNDLEVGFYFDDGAANPTPYFTYDVEVVTGQVGEVYLLSSINGEFAISVLTSDIAPVPIPASFLLLGSGLVGLIGFGKRMRKNIF